MCLQQKVTGIDKVYLRIGVVAAKGLGSLRQEERIVVAPYGQRRRKVFAEVLVKPWVGSHIRFVVTKQVELNLIIARTVEKMLIERIALRRNQRSIGLAMRVLKLRCAGLQQGPQIVAVLLGRILPVGANRIPALAQPILIRIAVLRNERGDA